MSSLKRKDAPGGSSTSTKKSKTNSDTRPLKRSKADQTPSKGDSKSKSKAPDADDSRTISLPTVSRLKEEEPLFPRGGASVLSPIEQKQIAAQAKQDVLFENQSGNAKNADGASKKKRKVKSSKSENSSKPVKNQDEIKIESLNFKRLVKGSLVLGQVIDINPLELTLALPNNLVGRVPITAVSDALNERIAAEVEGDEDDKSNEENDDEGVDLKTLFELGQYLRAHVNSTTDESPNNGSKSRRHIELSLQPELANTGLSKHEIVTNTTVMATVLSVEDHGFVMDIGLSGSGLSAFLPRKEVDSTISDTRLQPGSVFLCLVTGKTPNSKVAQLTTDQSKLGKVQNFASEATTVNTFLPGAAVDFLVSEVSDRGVAGKVMGSLDVTADLIHSGAGPLALDLESKFKVGKKAKARVVCTFPTSDAPKVGISLLEHVVSLKQKLTSSKKSPLDTLSISSLVPECTVKKVEPGIGLFVDIGVDGISGFVHISRVKDGKIDMLSESTGPFKVGSVHQGRVVGYNPVDGLFHLSFEKLVLEQPFLRIDDIPVGDVVNGEIEKIMVNQDGVSGLLVKLAEGIVGFVPEEHMADVRLQHPEKKFREKMKVKARVLSTDIIKRRVKLTLKKTLVNSEATPLKSFDQVSVGLQVPAIIISVLPHGAVVHFYGTLRGFLPVSEMSEAYIRDPKEHFRVGQVVNVHVLSFDADARKLIVSCKDPSAFGLDKQNALKNLKLGEIVSAKVVQKTEDDVYVEIGDASLKATLSVNHLADRPNKAQSSLKGIRVGQVLSELVVIDKNDSRRFIVLSKKPSLIKASQEKQLLTCLDDAKEGDLRQGFVRNITESAVFVQFFGQATALMPKSKMPAEDQKKPRFGLDKYQSILVKISSVDRDNGRIFAVHPSFDATTASNNKPKSADVPDDGLTVGTVTEAKIASVKGTQLNVRLANNVQGRVDVSEAFDTWDDIQYKKEPLKKFKPDQSIQVRVIGVHDSKNHRFLPISHRSTHSVLELSTKASVLAAKKVKPLSLETIQVGSSHLGFVNNVQGNSLWVSLSPNVRGRIAQREISEDMSKLEKLGANFPNGCALQVRVLAVNASEGHLDLSARPVNSSTDLSWDNVKPNMVLPGRITKINERQIIVQLSDSLSAPVHLIDLADDFSDANTMAYNKNEIVRVAVVETDKSNKKIRLSARPSRVLNSSLPVKDREITTISQVKAGDIVRGFVRHVGDKGLFVTLGGDVAAMVKISDLSDKFLKDWKDHYQIDQLVKGRIVSVDPTLKHVQMSLKASVVEKDYKPLLNFQDLRAGQTITGQVRKVEDFGAFILVDDSANVSGLCHRSEMAEKPVDDARKLFSEGDAVKAIVLDIDLQKKRVSLGLKPSYFEDEDSEMSEDGDESGVQLLGDDDDDDAEEDSDMEDGGGAVVVTGTDNDMDEDSDNDDEEDSDMADAASDDGVDALGAGGFDWSGNALDSMDVDGGDVENEAGATQEKKKKRRKQTMEADKSGDLDAFGPRTAVDYEQLLNRQPNSSALWIEYMAHQMQVSELAKARQVAERAINTINSSEETEKLNAWIAYLNLEVRFGSVETADAIFKRACQVNDQQEVYQRLASIYIQEGQTNKADDLFQTLVKKFGSTSPQTWYNYAHWLHSVQNQPERARALLPRAIQSLPNHAHLALMTKFATLEYTSAHKNPELGRTMFEELTSTFPKRFDLWNQLLDHEDVAGADKAVVRDVFERATKAKGLKARAAKKWFKRWADWEEKHGDTKSRDKVSAKAAEWVKAKAAAKEENQDEDGDDAE